MFNKCVFLNTMRMFKTNRHTTDSQHFSLRFMEKFEQLRSQLGLHPRVQLDADLQFQVVICILLKCRENIFVS